MCQELKYHIITYGCQMNKSDSERIASVLENIGYKKAPKENRADLIILNACSVRQSAIDRIYGKINQTNKLKTINYQLKTIITGCVLKKDTAKFKNMADIVLNIKDLPKLPDLLTKSKNDDIVRSDSSETRLANPYLSIQPKYQNKFIGYVPIMTGCNNFCSYCAVPYTRGGEISRPAEEIIREVKSLVKKGYKEIWLLGQNVNSYKPQTPNPKPQTNSKSKTQNPKLINFSNLLKKIDAIPGDFWIRFTSPHPKDFPNELIKTMARCEKFAPYLNLPVQSGNDKILKKMNRPYTVEHYKKLIKKIKKEFASRRKGLDKNIMISTDVIVGFPGETKKQFENTARLFREIGFDMAYIAQYSPRPGTAAAKMKDTVPREEKKKREKNLTEILKKSALKNNKKYLGKICEVLVEKSQKNFLLGKTRSYKTVKIYFNESLLPEQSRRHTISTQNLSPRPALRRRLRQGEQARGINFGYIGRFVKVKITGAMEWGLKGVMGR